MKIEIWSDIRCPFCYIGKRKFELALGRFPHKDNVEITWRSFQLDPGLKTQPGLHVYDYLARIKGLSRDETVRMHDHVRQVAREVNVEFNFEKAVVANSFNGHRLIQLAKTRGLGDQAEEYLFKAHFTEGRNIDDTDDLRHIGMAIGLHAGEVEDLLTSDRYSNAVKEDEHLARSLGIRAVPFFILNGKLAVSGAQSPDLFLQALTKAWSEYSMTPPAEPASGDLRTR
jgi:predicted DsbA family dithiol-disulfide isomerase